MMTCIFIQNPLLLYDMVDIHSSAFTFPPGSLRLPYVIVSLGLLLRTDS